MPMHMRHVGTEPAVLTLQEILAGLPSDGVLVTHVLARARSIDGNQTIVSTGTRSGLSLDTGWVLAQNFPPWKVASGSGDVVFTGLVRWRAI